jgi:hypothetical protein
MYFQRETERESAGQILVQLFGQIGVMVVDGDPKMMWIGAYVACKCDRELRERVADSIGTLQCEERIRCNASHDDALAGWRFRSTFNCVSLCLAEDKIKYFFWMADILFSCQKHLTYQTKDAFLLTDIDIMSSTCLHPCTFELTSQFLSLLFAHLPVIRKAPWTRREDDQGKMGAEKKI